MGDTWFKADANLPAHYKTDALVRAHDHVAFTFYVCALAYSKSRGTNGYIDRAGLATMQIPGDVSLGERLKLAKGCEEQRLFDSIGENEWVIHNWNKWQRPGRGMSNSGLSTDRTRLGMGSEVTLGQEKDLERDIISFSSPRDTTNGRAHDAHAHASEATPQATPLPARLLPAARDNVCPECEIPQGRHLIECPRGSGVPQGAIRSSTGGASSEGGCPSCGAPWGNGHRGECNYDPRHPLDAKPISGNDGAVMTPTDHIGNLRAVLRRRDGES
jgi:hypothetical protein